MRNLLKLRRPSPAMIVAIVALIVALTGTAMAGVATISKISGKTVKKNSLPGNRIKTNTVTGKQINESTLSQVPAALSLVAGAPQVSAFARVSDAGVVSAGTGVTSVTHSNPGRYCFDLAETPVTGTASAKNSTSPFRTVAYLDFPGGGACTAPNTDALVAIETNGAFADASFNVVFVK